MFLAEFAANKTKEEISAWKYEQRKIRKRAKAHLYRQRKKSSAGNITKVNETPKEDVKKDTPALCQESLMGNKNNEEEVVYCNDVCLETEYSAVVEALIGNGGDINAAVVKLFHLKTDEETIAPESQLDEHVEGTGSINTNTICLDPCLEHENVPPVVRSTDSVLVLSEDFLMDDSIGLGIENEYSEVVETLIENGGDVDAAFIELFRLETAGILAAPESEGAQGAGIINSDIFCFDPCLEKEEYPVIYEALEGCSRELDAAAGDDNDMIHKWEEE